MEYSKVEKSLGSWGYMFKEFITSEAMDKLFGYIRERKKVARICPDSADVFRCFTATPPDKVRVIIAGISPYHTWVGNDKGNWKAAEQYPIADGLALSCSRSWRIKGLQPSLEMFYDQVEHVYTDGLMDPNMVRDGDLKYLAEQGVLLYNVALTVEENKACSHNDAWMPFNKFFWEEVVNKYMKGVCVILLGQQAHKSEQYINPLLHYIFKCEHPASASYKGATWDDGGTFKAIDKILMDNNGSTVQWKSVVPF